MPEIPGGGPPGEPSDLLADASRWHERMTSGSADEQMLQDFEEWRSADIAHARSYADVEQAWTIVQHAACSPEALALRHETLARLIIKKRPVFWQRAIAASLVAGLAGSLLWMGLRVSDRTSQAPAMASGVYQTAVGERLVITLADGSTAILNTASRLRTVYTASERRLLLEEGQASFDVAKAQPRPFIVVAGDRTITAHGTSFDVRLGRGEIKIALLEGLVSVRRANVPASAEIRLKPHEMLLAKGERTLVRALQKSEQITSWREGLIIFENDTLSDAVSEMNRYVRRPIVLGNPAIGKLRISGAFRTGETGAFVEALEQSFPIKVAGQTSSQILLTARD